MLKSLLQFIIFAGIFFSSWFALSRVDWMDRFKIQKIAKEKQEQIAEWVLDLKRANKKTIEDEEVLQYINHIKTVLCEENYVDTSVIKVHVFEDPVINAFALPGGHIVLNTGLINFSDNPDMLAGVLAHEIAHVELDHVSRKLSREIGISTLIALTGGTEHMTVLKEILRTLSSRSFDRDMEREADKRAVIFMRNANGDYRQLAFFLKKISKKYGDMPEAFQWASTHPATDERVETILTNTGSVDSNYNILNAQDWACLKERTKDL